MTHVITSNPLSVKSIKAYNDNFIITDSTEKLLIPLNASQSGYEFRIYHQDGMSLDDYDDYSDENGFRYRRIPVTAITEALDLIAKSIISEEQSNPMENPEEMRIITACGIEWNSQVTRYLNDRFRDAGSEISCLDIYRYLKATNMDRLVNLVKTSLNSRFVYPEDPVAFGYAMIKVLGGVVR